MSTATKMEQFTPTAIGEISTNATVFAMNFWEAAHFVRISIPGSPAAGRYVCAARHREFWRVAYFLNIKKFFMVFAERVTTTLKAFVAQATGARLHVIGLVKLD